jgi:hypothetical protein
MSIDGGSMFGGLDEIKISENESEKFEKEPSARVLDYAKALMSATAKLNEVNLGTGKVVKDFLMKLSKDERIESKVRGEYIRDFKAKKMDVEIAYTTAKGQLAQYPNTQKFLFEDTQRVFPSSPRISATKSRTKHFWHRLSGTGRTPSQLTRQSSSPRTQFHTSPSTP